MVYKKSRYFMCLLRREDGVDVYDRIINIIRTKGTQGKKAYFAAEFRSSGADHQGR